MGCCKPPVGARGVVAIRELDLVEKVSVDELHREDSATDDEVVAVGDKTADALTDGFVRVVHREIPLHGGHDDGRAAGLRYTAEALRTERGDAVVPEEHAVTPLTALDGPKVEDVTDVLAAPGEAMVDRRAPPEVHVGRGRVRLVRLEVRLEQQLVWQQGLVSATTRNHDHCHGRAHREGAHETGEPSPLQHDDEEIFCERPRVLDYEPRPFISVNS